MLANWKDPPSLIDKSTNSTCILKCAMASSSQQFADDWGSMKVICEKNGVSIATFDERRVP